jgi:CHASE2 domain-containing sensor protein
MQQVQGITMAQRIVVRLRGNLHQGYDAQLTVGPENMLPKVERNGTLPPNPDLEKRLKGWRQGYFELVNPPDLRNFSDVQNSAPSGLTLRISQVTVNYEGALVPDREQVRQLAQDLREEFNYWLCSPSFAEINHEISYNLNSDQQTRVLVLTSDLQSRYLPWNCWSCVADRPLVSVGIGPHVLNLSSKQRPRQGQTNQVRILAVLGNKQGIDVEADRRALAQLPDAKIHILDEPSRQQLHDQLWKEPWDILFFAGHGRMRGETSYLKLNQTDELDLEGLQYALNRAVSQGLQLAIFNSCDGLGLTQALEQVAIPQMIVMQAPIPDRVAQDFLKYFLESFAEGKPLYGAVAEARQRLQWCEKSLPCATWLPTVCPNSLLEPPTWQDLVRKTPELPKSAVSPLPTWQVGLVASMAVSMVVLGIRGLGMLQGWELAGYDHLMRMRPDRGLDDRILVVEITEADIQAQDPLDRRGISLSDPALEQLLTILLDHQPRIIGLDLYRDFPVQPEFPGLAQQLQESKNLVAICKVNDESKAHPGIEPPPEIKPDRLGFSDVLPDRDGVLRRYLWFMTPNLNTPCQTQFSFSLKIVLDYLHLEAIQPEVIGNKLRLAGYDLPDLTAHAGGYQGIDDQGYQMLLDYRTPGNVAHRITLTELFQGKFEAEWIRDKVVLVGVTAGSREDVFKTPFSHQNQDLMPGVMIHAHMISQILDGVLEGRPWLRVWPNWVDMAWIITWTGLSSVIALRQRRLWKQFSLISLGLLGLYGLCRLFFVYGFWVPLIPPSLVLILTLTGILLYRHRLNSL